MPINSQQYRATQLRELALHILTEILTSKDAFSLESLIQKRVERISESDLAWVRDVCAGVLRWQGRLGLALDRSASKKRPSGRLRKILMIALYQILLQDRVIPEKVVNEVVTEIKAKEGLAQSKFANAVLRKWVADSKIFFQSPANNPLGASEESAWWSLPDWLWKKLKTQRGLEWARGFAQASLERPQIWMRAKDPQWKPEWAKAGPLEKSWTPLEGGRIFKKPGFAEGAFIVQDLSSQYAVEEVSKSLREHEPKKALRVLDLCAAPGGKAIGLAWNGFAVTATDINPKRLERLNENLSRIKTQQISIIPYADAIQKASLKKFDVIWVDAPCSSTGVIRRHPEIRWLKKSEDLQALIKIQKELVIQAWDLLPQGGHLVYSVCSVLKEEGSGLVSAAGLEKHLLQSWGLSPHLPPHGDGFWLGLLEKP